MSRAPSRKFSGADDAGAELVRRELDGEYVSVSNLALEKPVLHIGLSSWIIQDGNYGDFTVGQRAKFALEFAALDVLRPAAEAPLQANLLVIPSIVFAPRRIRREDVWCSMLAHHATASGRPTMRGSEPPRRRRVPRVDPFFYFEGLHSIRGMPPFHMMAHPRDTARDTPGSRRGMNKGALLTRGRPEVVRIWSRRTLGMTTMAAAITRCLRAEGGPSAPTSGKVPGRAAHAESQHFFLGGLGA